MEQAHFSSRASFQFCLPEYPSCIDLFSLLPTNPQPVWKWLNDPEASLTLETTFPQAKALQHCFFEHRNTRSIHGFHLLRLGFPIIGYRTSDQQWVAPLLLWPVRLVPANTTQNQWSLHKTPPALPEVNQELAQSLKRLFDLDLYDLLAPWLEEGKTFKNTDFEMLLQTLHEELGTAADFPTTWQSLPTGEAIDEMEGPPVLFAAAVLGLFDPQHPDWSPSELHAVLQQEDRPSEGHTLGLYPLDPYQATAFRHTLQKKQTVVYGGAGTGKTQLAAQVISNNLSNKRRCLVISDNIRGLKNLQSYLTRFGLHQLHFVLQDNLADRQLFFEIIRAAVTAEPSGLQHDEVRFQQLVDKLTRGWKNLHEPYEASRKRVFQDQSWLESVGLFLASNRVQGKELLSSHLLAADFQFDEEEFASLAPTIEVARPYYEAVNTLHHPLNELGSSIFSEMQEEDAHIYVSEETDRILQKATRLHQRYIAKGNAYSDRLFIQYEKGYQQVFETLRHLRHLIAEGVNQFGSSFKQSSGSGLRLRAVFSAKAKEEVEMRASIGQEYDRFKQAVEELRIIESPMLSQRESQDIAGLEAHLSALSDQLEQWRANLSKKVQDDIRRLNHKTVASKTGFEDQIQVLEEDLDLLIADLNNVGIYQEPVTHNMLTLPKRQQFLENLIDRLESTQLFMRDFSPFYHWRRAWLQLSPAGQKVVKALIKVKADDWTTAFKSWYLHNLLSRVYQPVLPKKDFSFSTYSNDHKQLVPELVPQIVALWQEEKRQQLKELRRSNKVVYQELFGKTISPKVSNPQWRKLVREGLDAITSIIPVWFMPAELAVQLLGGLEDHFDQLIIEDAHFLEPNLISPLLSLAKKVLITGNSAHAHQSDDHLLKSLVENEVPHLSLRIIHRWTPGNILQLNQATYISETAIQPYEVHFQQVDGRFEEKSQTNEAEAQAVLHVLNQIEKTQQRTYPSVSIICLQAAQRNLVASYLEQLRKESTPGGEKIRQLFRNGLGIYSPGELNGLHTDIVILSGTYGTKDVKGELTPQIERFNRPGGPQLLRLLMSRTLKELFVLNSIPSSDIDQLLQQKTANGTYLYGLFLRYTEALSKGDAAQQSELAAAIRELDPPIPPRLQHLEGFMQEVALLLQPYLKPGRLKTGYTNAHYYFPLLVERLNTQQAPILICPDGYWSVQPFTDFQWEYEYYQQLRKAGFQILPIWSELWWKAPETQARKLASTINRLDGEFKA